MAGREEEAEAIAQAVEERHRTVGGMSNKSDNTHISWKRMLARSNALETSDRSMAASMAQGVVS